MKSTVLIASLGITVLGWTLFAAAVPSPPAQAPGPGGAPAAPSGRGYARPQVIDFQDHDGWRSLFDGRSLTGWDGNRDVWKVEDGVIVAQTTPEHRIGTTFLIWKDEPFADFELKLEVKLTDTVNSGIAYRSWIDPDRGARLGPAAAAPPAPPRTGGPAPGRGGRGPQGPVHVASDPRWMLYGAGMDNDADRRTTGNIEDRGTARRLIGWRGAVVRTAAGKLPSLIGTLGDPDVLREVIKADDWNQVHIIAKGGHLTHIINGQTMAMTFDDDATFLTPSGLLGWSIETGGFGRVMVRSVWIRTLR